MEGVAKQCLSTSSDQMPIWGEVSPMKTDVILYWQVGSIAHHTWVWTIDSLQREIRYPENNMLNVSLWTPQIPYVLHWDWTWASRVGSQGQLFWFDSIHSWFWCWFCEWFQKKLLLYWLKSLSYGMACSYLSQPM